MEVDLRMGLEKGCDQFGLMSGKVVGNDMDRFACGLGGDDLGQKIDELHTGMAGRGFAQDQAALGFEGGIKREGAVAEILEAVGLGATRRKRQDRVQTIERLDGTFFINAEDGGVRGRVQIKADDISRFGFELGVVADHVLTQEMRSQAVAAPDPSHRHVGEAELFRQPPTAPMRAAVCGWSSGPIQNPGLQSGRPLARGTSLMTRHQAAQASGAKAPGPALHIRSGAGQGGGSRANPVPAGQSQNDLGALRILGSNAARTAPAF